jgi:two-component system cell cycle sensor histidine kinase/response regulator CckA
MNVITQFPAARDYERDLRFREMFEQAAVGIGICRLDGRILEANPALSRMLGYSQQELAGTRADELYPELSRELFPETDGAVGWGEVGQEEIEREIYSSDSRNDHSSNDDSQNHDLRNNDLVDDDLPNERLLGELMRGERASFEIEKRYQRKDGSEFWGHLTVSLGCDARRAPAFLIAMLADATERRRAEEHLREAEKMEVIGRLAGGIAHDFNNLLTGILLYCDLLSAGLENDGLENDGLENDGLANGGFERDRLQNNGLQNSGLQNDALRAVLSQHVREVRLAGEQGAALTHQLLAIARKQAAEPRPILLDEVVASARNLLQRLIGEQIELVISLGTASLDSASLDSMSLNAGSPDTRAGMVLADPAQLRQILLNLVLNARDAMPQGGEIHVSTRTAEFPSDGEPGKAKRAVALAVKDNGCGMDAETRARLFEPFFTTKNPGEGTGLGLATVQRIVSEAGGRIEVASEPGRGTLIEIFLPVIETPKIKIPQAEVLNSAASNQVRSIEASAIPTPANARSGKTILLVDDHAAARKSMQHLLLNAGYRILAASSGKQALKIFSEHSSTVDLVITDCMIPGTNGRELAETLRGQKPELKVLLVSGYQDAPVGLAVGSVELVRKPFSGRNLIERVVDIMQS